MEESDARPASSARGLAPIRTCPAPTSGRRSTYQGMLEFTMTR